jgi:hypothetical protein
MAAAAKEAKQLMPWMPMVANDTWLQVRVRVRVRARVRLRLRLRVRVRVRPTIPGCRLVASRK